jgi:hypothetical protein
MLGVVDLALALEGDVLPRLDAGLLACLTRLLLVRLS